MNQGSWIPPVDIYQNGNHEIVLKVELPDVRREDIQVAIDDNTLTIKGEKQLSDEVKEDQFQRIERSYGTSAVPSRCRRTLTPQSSVRNTRTVS